MKPHDAEHLRLWLAIYAITFLLALMIFGCSQTTGTYKDGTATITRNRFLMTEDIDSFTYDASDGSFILEGYKSDMTRALELIDKLVDAREGSERWIQEK